MHKLWRSGSLDFDDSVARDPVAAHRLRTALRHQEVFGSDQASATLLHQTRVGCPVSDLVRHTISLFDTPSHHHNMCTTRRTWTHASMDGVRDEREKRREQVS